MKIIALATSKRCSRCKERKATTEFVKDSSTTSGLNSNCKSCTKLYSQASSEKRKLYNRNYYQTHRKERLQSNNSYKIKRMKTDPLFKLICTLRKIGSNAKSKFGIKTRTALLLGCTWAEAQAHLIQTAILNYGSYSETAKYDIDHKIPLASAINAEEMTKLCHISNLQLLTPPDNRAKGAKLNWSLGGIHESHST